MSDPVTFGQWLRQRRKSYDLSQDGLAGRVGCVFETIRKIESGRRKPSRQLAELLARHLGVPAEQLEDFILFARQGVSEIWSVGVPAAEQKYRSTTRTSNLPAERTSLVGRDEEAKSVSTLLMQPTTRLVTLTGPPGIGKTRLGMKVAASLAERFADGVVFVSLSHLADPGAVASAINQVIGLPEADSRPPASTLKNWLEEKETLLLLDNFEQVVAARSLVSDLIDACPDLKVLVTSRSALRIYGEQQFSVPTLPLPDSASSSYSSIASNPSVDLFVQRARAANPLFKLVESNAPAVANICRKLDGLPLAIELAAAQSKALSPNGILARLDKQLELLVEGAHDLPPRQRTLRAAITWSYDLLDPNERTLFRRLSVFSGGCNAEAIEEICLDPEPAEAAQGSSLLAGVNSLLDRSLLQPWNGPDGEPRFRALDAVREYAREVLDRSGETTRLQQQHALYFLRLAEKAEPELTSGRREPYLARLDADLDNLRAALNWCLADPSNLDRIAMGLRMAGALHWFWYFRSLISEGRRWLEKALSMSEALKTTPPFAAALAAAGRLALLQDDYAVMQSRLLDSVAAWRSLSDKSGLAFALTNLGLATVYRTRSAGEGYPHIESAIDLFRSIEEKWGLAFALDALGDATLLSGGEASDALRYREESLALYKELGDDWGVASQLTELGHAYLRRGDYERARQRLEQALRIQRATGDRWVIVHTVRSLGDVAWYQRDLDRARALYAESLLICRDLGDRLRESFALRNIGRIAIELGDHEEAASLYRQSLSIAYDLNSEQNIALCLIALAEVLILEGESVRAARILGKAESLRETSRGMMPPTDRIRYDYIVAELHAKLPEPGCTDAWQEGRSMSMASAIAEVGEDEP